MCERSLGTHIRSILKRAVIDVRPLYAIAVNVAYTGDQVDRALATIHDFASANLWTCACGRDKEMRKRAKKEKVSDLTY